MVIKKGTILATSSSDQFERDYRKNSNIYFGVVNRILRKKGPGISIKDFPRKKKKKIKTAIRKMTKAALKTKRMIIYDEAHLYLNTDAMKKASSYLYGAVRHRSGTIVL